MPRSLIHAAAICAMMLATPAIADVVKLESTKPVKDTMDRFEAIVKDRGLTVFARIDHAAGAKAVDLPLRPTELLVFGNPKTGTPLMQAAQTMGLSLPMKVLVWQDAENKVWIGYDPPADVAAERGITRDNPVVVQVTEALKGLAGAAAKP